MSKKTKPLPITQCEYGAITIVPGHEYIFLWVYDNTRAEARLRFTQYVWPCIKECFV